MQENARQGSGHRVQRRYEFAATLLVLLFVAGVIAAPLLETGGRAAGGWLRLAYAPLCHQNPERSLELASRPMAVCARCSGLYFGGAAGLALGFAAALSLGRVRRRWLLLAILPTVVEGLLSWTGLAGLPNLPRHLLGWPAGFAFGMLLARGLLDIVNNRARSDRERKSGRPLEVTHG